MRVLKSPFRSQEERDEGSSEMRSPDNEPQASSTDVARAHFNLGVDRLDQNRFDEAITEFRSTLEADPGFTPAKTHFYLGFALGQKGHWKQAIQEFQASLRSNPDSALLHYNLGLAYAHDGRHDDEIREYEVAIKLQPFYPDAHYAIAVAYAEQDRLEDFAREVWIAARQGSPQAQDVLATMGESPEPRTNARQESVLLCNHGIEAKRHGDYDLALQFYDQARRADPANPQVYHNIGKLFFGLGEYGQSFRNLLTYANLGLAVGLFDRQMLPLVGQIYACKPQIAPGVCVRADIVQVLCLDNPLVFSYASDPNLARYAGLCYLARHPSLIGFHQLGDEMLALSRAAVLQKSTTSSPSPPPAPGIVLAIGFLYIAQNLYDQRREQDYDRYLSNRFLIDEDLARWQVS